MAEFSGLSSEVQTAIIEQLDQADAPVMVMSLKNASLVSRKWRQIAGPLLFKNVVLAAGPKRCQKTDDHIDFLLSNNLVRSYIQELTISFQNDDVIFDFWPNLERLLPQLSSLRHVTIFGDNNAVIYKTAGYEDADDEDEEAVIDMNKVRNMILGKLKALGRQITVSLDRCFHTMDGESMTQLGNLDLSILSTTASPPVNPGTYFSSLRVALLEPPQGWPFNLAFRVGGYAGCASEEVNSLLRLHHHLRKLDLEVPSINDEDWRHRRHHDEKPHAMHSICPLQPHLVSLTIQGDLLVSDSAWACWQGVPWSQLEELSLSNHTLINDLAHRLCHRPLPRLKTLRLFKYDHQWRNKEKLLPDEDPVLREFLCPLGVSQLSLTGLAPETLMHYLGHAPRNRQSLRKLRFHVAESGGLAAPQLDELARCPRLSWLGVDAGRGDLPCHEVPDRALGYLDALAQLRPLTQLRLFLKCLGRERAAAGPDVLEIADAVAAFQHIQKQKKGCLLESMVICRGASGYQGIWSIWPWGSEKVVVDFRLSNKLRRVEIWDLSKKAKSEEYAAGRAQWRYVIPLPLIDKLWGVPEGW